jgi:hypothetical protein
MTFTYTSADLAEIAASIPGYTKEAGLIIVPGVEISKDADVQVASHEADISDALKLAALVKAPFISVGSERFWAERIRHTDGYKDLPPTAERLLKAAEKHDDSLMSVEVSWVADGLVYEWVAQSDWIGSLLIDIDAPVEAAEAESDDADRANLTEYYTNIQAAATVLAESRKYRGEQVGKRRHIMTSIIAEEQDFRARKAEVADELRNYPAWQVVYTKAKRKDAAMKFLAKKADGHRLSTDLAEEISEAAANPVYVSRY